MKKFGSFESGQTIILLTMNTGALYVEPSLDLMFPFLRFSTFYILTSISHGAESPNKELYKANY